MLDRLGRTIDYARISITDRCNLRCAYCMPKEGITPLPSNEILSYDEILRICRCMAELGIRKVKLTGGEPLVREDCAALAAGIKEINGIEKVTLTTNGVLLKDKIEELAKAGVDAVNISLDTLDAEEFEKVTRRDRLEDVLCGIEEALKYPKIPLKINSVPVSENAENFVAMASLAKKYPIHVRFIEMMPIGYGKQFPFQDEESIKGILEQAYGRMKPSKSCLGNGPCHYYELDGFQGKIGFISAITHKFCDKCNRIRLTPEGYLKACLQFQVGTDLRGLMRAGGTDEELMVAIKTVIEEKPHCHHFNEIKEAGEEQRGMSQIGG